MIAGAYDVVVAAGVEVMTRVPMGASMVDGKFGFPFGPEDRRRATQAVGGLVPQGISAELIADKWGLTPRGRSTRSASRVAAARRPGPRDEGRFEREILPVTVDADGGSTSVTRRRGHPSDPRSRRWPSSSRRSSPTAMVTAGNSSQITDGAAALLIMSEEKAAALGLTPRARFLAFALAGVDPVTMLTGPDPGHQEGARAGRA